MVSVKIPIGVTLTNVETRSQTAPFPSPFPPPLDLKVRSLTRNVNLILYILRENVNMPVTCTNVWFAEMLTADILSR